MRIFTGAFCAFRSRPSCASGIGEDGEKMCCGGRPRARLPVRRDPVEVQLLGHLLKAKASVYDAGEEKSGAYLMK